MPESIVAVNGTGVAPGYSQPGYMRNWSRTQRGSRSTVGSVRVCCVCMCTPTCVVCVCACLLTGSLSPHRYGYVEFESGAMAQKAMSKLQGEDVDGREMRIDIATPRGGGGGGGRGGYGTPRGGGGRGEGLHG